MRCAKHAPKGAMAVFTAAGLLLTLTTVVSGKSPAPADRRAPDASESDRPAQMIEAHEWGMISINLSGEDWPNDLPAFVHTPKDIPATPLPAPEEPRPPRFREDTADKPVVYFHAPQATRIDFDVRFPLGGAPTVFFPNASRLEGDRLRFANLTILPDGISPAPQRAGAKVGSRAGEVIARDHWWNTCAAAGGTTRVVSGDEVESFLFYEGRVAYLPPVTVSVAAKDGQDEITFSNWGEFELADFLGLHRAGDKLYAEWLGTVPAASGATPGVATMRVKHGSAATAEAAIKDLAARVQKTGLTAAEAEAFAHVWRGDILGRNAPRCMYRLAGAQLDRLMPVSIVTEAGWTSTISRAEYVAVLDGDNILPQCSAKDSAESLFARGAPAYASLVEKRAKLLAEGKADEAKVALVYINRLEEKNPVSFR